MVEVRFFDCGIIYDCENLYFLFKIFNFYFEDMSELGLYNVEVLLYL